MITFTYSNFGKTAESYSSPLGYGDPERPARLTRSIRSATGRVSARRRGHGPGAGDSPRPRSADHSGLASPGLPLAAPTALGQPNPG